MKRQTLSLVLLALFLTPLVSLPAAEPERVPLMETFRLAGRELNPAAPPLGLKTYSDLGLMIEESILGYELIAGHSAPPPSANASDTDTVGRAVSGPADLPPLTPHETSDGSLVFPLSVKNCRIMIGLGGAEFPFRPEWQRFDNPHVLWTSYSKDGGHTWSEPRFLAALVDASDGAGIGKITLRPVRGQSLKLSFENGRDRSFEMYFKEYELRKLATVDDLLNAPPGRFVLRSTPRGSDAALLADAVCVGQDIRITPDRLPKGCELRKDLGLIVAQSIAGQVVHTAKSKSKTLFESRVVVTPKGDYLVFIPDGSHGNTRNKKGNILTAYRSSDQGRTWQGPFFPFGEGRHYGVLPVVPKGSDRLFVFETVKDATVDGRIRTRTFISRYSDDDGHHWSEPEIPRLENGRPYGGLGVIPMSASETAAGTLFAGFHHGSVLRGALGSGGRVWSALTLPKASESETPFSFHLNELQLISPQDSEVIAMARTTEGHLWEARSSDDGKTWSVPRRTPLVHPDAPPMMARLDETTMIALHHHRAVLRSVCEPEHSQWLTLPNPTEADIAKSRRMPSSTHDWVSRAEVWFSLSRDGGETWSEPRFLFANALAESLDMANPNYQCSYIDLFADKGRVHLIVPHRWQRVVHLSFPADQLAAFLTRDELRRALPTRKN